MVEGKRVNTFTDFGVEKNSVAGSDLCVDFFFSEKRTRRVKVILGLIKFLQT